MHKFASILSLVLFGYTLTSYAQTDQVISGTVPLGGSVQIEGSIAVGGGTTLHPSTVAWIADDINGHTIAPLENQVIQLGTNGPGSNRWGDYLRSRPHSPHDKTWIATGFSMQGSTSEAVPRLAWFGREKSVPQVPPMFSKTYASDFIITGTTTTLTFTIDNSANAFAAATNLGFTDNLPSGMTLATPANASTTCTGGTFTAPDGGTSISYTGGSVAAGATCTLTVDVTSTFPNSYTNTSGDLTSSLGNSGSATDDLLVDAARPTFSKAFSPASIGLGGTSTLTIEHTGRVDAKNLDFTDNLPAGVTVASPTNQTKTCTGGMVAAAGGSFSYSGGTVPATSSCTISVDVTSSAAGTHTNISGDLTSSHGNSGSATADLEVLEVFLPIFSKSFSPNSIPLGSKSTLTFTIDNSANPNRVDNLDFTDNLPTGIVVASPSNATTDCGTATIPPTLRAVSGTRVIILDANGVFSFPALAAGATCTVSVEVLGTGIGTHTNVSEELLANFVASGIATATLEVTGAALNLSKSFTDDPVPPGSTVTLEFSIQNSSRTDAATGVTFSDDLDGVFSGLAAVGLPANDVCGAGSLLSGAGLITFTGGTLPGGGSCTFSVTLQVPAGATPGMYTNTTGTITGSRGGGVVTGNMATDQLVVSSAPAITKAFIDDPVAPGDDVILEFTITNTSATSTATNITFTDILSALPAPLSITGPADGFCGAGSTMVVNPGSSASTGTPAQLDMSGGTLAPSGNCTFQVTITIPAGMSNGTYANTTEPITATVGGTPTTGGTASDDLIIVAGPTLTKSFTDDPVQAGGTVTLEFTLTHDTNAPGNATDISFTDDLNAALLGLAATGLPQTDVCGAGSQLTGTTLLDLTGGTLAPGQSCMFSVTLQTPAGATPGFHTNTTSAVGTTVQGRSVTSAPASDDLEIASLTFSKEFIDDPAVPGGQVTLRFEIENIHASQTATTIAFTDNLVPVLTGLIATNLPLSDPCGAGSQLTGSNGNSFLTLTGGSLAAGTLCTFDVNLQVPAAAVLGAHTNTTSTLSASLGGTAIVVPPAVDALTVSTAQVQFTKTFTDDPVAPGGSVTLEFTVTNPDPNNAVSDMSFTDDLGAVLSGLVATGLPVSNVCGDGSSLSGSSVLSFSNGVLGASSSCTFSVTLQVPGSAVSGVYPNTTSSVMANGLEVGQPATDALIVGVAQNLAVSVKLFLQGAYVPGNVQASAKSEQAGSMRTDLLAQNIVPQNQPFNTAPWNYLGSEVVNPVPPGTVDWVLLQLRATPDGPTLGQRAALLMADGAVVDMGGTAPVVFAGLPSQDYYVIALQQNHLGVMSADPVAIGASTPLYDFTTDDRQAYSKPVNPQLPMVEVETGVFALWAGDANADGKIQYTGPDSDVNAIIATLTLANLTQTLAGYFGADLDLNGVVQYVGLTRDVRWIEQNLGLPYLDQPLHSQVP